MKDSGSRPDERGMERMAHVLLSRPHRNIIKADIQEKQLQETPAVPRTSGQIMTAWRAIAPMAVVGPNNADGK